MHYTGTIWRPPYEAESLLLEVTAGCTHHSCKFCTLYDELPFRFRISPMEDIEADLMEAQSLRHAPDARQMRALLGLPEPQFERVFLVGANPFALSARRLEVIAQRVRQYLPECRTIGCFARVTDVTAKSDDDLKRLQACGYSGLTIGVETGDDRALTFMNKGYTAQDIVEQCARLDSAQIPYNFFYLTGISGAGRGVESASLSAEIFNATHPTRIGSSMLTVFPESALYREIQAGNWREASEMEKIEELRALIAGLRIPTFFAALGASNAIQFQGALPKDKKKLLDYLSEASAALGEDRLYNYRTTLRSL